MHMEGKCKRKEYRENSQRLLPHASRPGALTCTREERWPSKPQRQPRAHEHSYSPHTHHSMTKKRTHEDEQGRRRRRRRPLLPRPAALPTLERLDSIIASLEGQGGGRERAGLGRRRKECIRLAQIHASALLIRSLSSSRSAASSLFPLVTQPRSRLI